MPTYEYRCGACGKEQDVVQKMSDPPMVDCPLCGAPRMERLVSASAFALRGGGWYADGYGNKPGAAPAASDGSAASTASTPSSSDASAKTDGAAKDAPKPEPAKKPEPAPSSSSGSS
jgi:putative FmdB family regulatory protein